MFGLLMMVHLFGGPTSATVSVFPDRDSCNAVAVVQRAHDTENVVTVGCGDRSNIEAALLSFDCDTKHPVRTGSVLSYRCESTTIAAK
jgi:hypothetical protein